MQWVREHSKPYKLELKYSPRHDDWRKVQSTLIESKQWCKQNGLACWDDGFFYVRFSNEDDLAWFLLRWA